MRIAIVTGASGGLGKEFAKLLLNEDVDEIWAVARNEEKLLALQQELGDKIIVVSKDLSITDDIMSIKSALEAQKPVIAYLVNSAGIARMGTYADFSPEDVDATIRTNCVALAMLCTICIPYMSSGSRILNLSSASSFQPLPYLNLYAATKVFERSYSRALNAELKGTGITSTAVCPSWVDTDMLTKETNGKTIKLPGIVSPRQAAKKAMHDAQRGKDMSVCTMYVKGLHVLSKLLPQKTIMYAWVRQIKKYTADGRPA